MNSQSFVAVVTGASSGIGEATARRLAREPGARLVLVARREERLRTLAESLGVPAGIVAVDLTSEGAPGEVLRHVQERHGRLDLLVNNAGAGWRARFADGGHANVSRTMELNFDAQVRLTEALLPLLRESAPSAIVNVSSVSGRVGRAGSGAYSASKFALAGWSESLYLEERASGVHVGLVLPGFISTEGFPAEELKARLLTRWAVSRPERVADAEMTIALAPSKRVTTALRWPTVWVAPEAGAPPPAGAGAGAEAAACGTGRVLAGGAGAAPPGALRRARLGRRLAEQPFQHRQQLRGVGMLEEDDADLAAVGGAAVEILGDADQVRDRGGVAAEGDRVGAVDRHHRDAVGRELGQSGGDLARAGELRGRRRGSRRIDVDPRQHLPSRAILSAKSETMIEPAVGGDRAVAADQRPQALDRGGGLDVADAEDLGDEAGGIAAPAAADRRGRGGAGDRLDAEGAAPDRHRDEAVGAHRREEQFEIFAGRERPLGDHRDPALDGGIDDEGAPGHPRRVLDEGADVGVAQVQHMLRLGGRQRARRASAKASKRRFTD